MGYAYVRLRGHGYTLQANWMTRETMVDVLVSVMHAVNLVRLFRDRFSHLPCPLYRAGTDCFEDFFSQLGMQTRNKHNATVGEALERGSQLLRRDDLRSQQTGLKFADPKRRENRWFLGNGYDTDEAAVQRNLANLSDYGSVDDASVHIAWDEGLGRAREHAERLGMREVLEGKGVWEEPWVPFVRATAQVGEGEEASQGDEESDRWCEDMGGECEVDPDLGFIRASVLDGAQERDMGMDDGGLDAGETGSGKISPTVDVPGVGPVYKMRLIAECNVNPDKLPVDRLRRVRHRVPTASGVEDVGDVGLHDRVAVAILDGSGMHTWHIGQVLAMSKVLEGGRKVEYFLPVSLEACDDSIRLLLKYFTVVDETNPRLLQYGGCDGAEVDPIPLSAVICRIVSLKMTEDKVFEMSETELGIIEMYVDANNEKMRDSRKKRAGRQAEEEARSDPGRDPKRRTTTRSGRKATKLAPPPIVL
jgi:hypothetical protein